MAKGKATSVTKASAKAKAKSSGARAKTETTRVKGAGTGTSAAKEASRTTDIAERGGAKGGATAPATSGVKKKNVKRGAPPMLPRRMSRRPETPAGPPPAVRSMTVPGSLHAPAREPEGAESLKQRIGAVMTLLAQLRALKRTIHRQFFEAGLLLRKLSDPTLYSAKGYGSFEAFIEREIERELSIGRSLAHDLVQIVRVFQREAAEELGLDRLRSALRTLWPEPGPATGASQVSTGSE